MRKESGQDSVRWISRWVWQRYFHPGILLLRWARHKGNGDQRRECRSNQTSGLWHNYQQHQGETTNLNATVPTTGPKCTALNELVGTNFAQPSGLLQALLCGENNEERIWTVKLIHDRTLMAGIEYDHLVKDGTPCLTHKGQLFTTFH